jgi:hypothetical protein
MQHAVFEELSLKELKTALREAGIRFPSSARMNLLRSLLAEHLEEVWAPPVRRPEAHFDDDEGDNLDDVG